jgi:ERCC4-type nuclease
LKANPRQQMGPLNPKYLTPFTFKPVVIPPEMCLIVDTREQNSPLFLDKPPKGLMVMRDCLTAGDYGIRGLPNFSIERKYRGDLFSYCSTEMDTKTYKKMETFKQMIAAGGWVGLVIEEPMSNIYKWQEHTRISPECVRGALSKFAIHYGVHVHFSGNRENASRYILDMAVRYYNMVHEL